MTTEPTPPPGTPPPPSQRNKVVEWVTTGVVAPLITLLLIGLGTWFIASKVADANFATLKRDVRTNAASNTAAQEREAKERKTGQDKIMDALKAIEIDLNKMGKKQAVMNNEMKNINKAVQANSQDIKGIKKQLTRLEIRIGR